MIRWLLAIGCSVFSVKLMIKGLGEESFAAAPFLIISFASVISAVLLIAPETVFKIAEAFSRIFGALEVGAVEASPPQTLPLMICE